MKVIKPQTLSLLTRPYEFRRQCHLGIAILAFVPLDGRRTLLPEMALWPFAAEHLPEGTVLDEAIPKRGGEVLVVGQAWPRPAVDSTKCRVQVQLGEIDKTLNVFGERRFNGDRISQPQAFESMALDWTRSFGGPGFAPNPLGRGIESELDERGTRQFVLPNVELPDQLLRLRGQQPRPAGLGPIDRLWPQRLKRAGTYGPEWLRQQFPGLATDIDWRYFNLADADQHQARPFSGDERYRLLNLHPERGLIEGQLPGIMARCLIRRDDQAEPAEVSCALTTVWCFPEQERAVLVFHASIEVAEPDATDVRDILIAADDLDSPRPLEHYLAVRTKRLDPERAPYEALNDRVLLPDTLEQGELPTLGDLVNGGGQIRRKLLEAQMAREQARLEQTLKAKGLQPPDLKQMPGNPGIDPEEIMGLRLDQVPDLMMEMEKSMSEARAKMAARQQEAEALLREVRSEDGRSGARPPDFRAVDKAREIRDRLAEMARHGFDTRELEQQLLSDEALDNLRFVEKSQITLYRRSAHMQDPPSLRKDGEPLRRRLRELIEAGQSLAGEDFTGLDLRGFKFNGADLGGIFLSGSDLREVDLRGARLDQAVLAHCDLRQARLDTASLHEANLGKSRMDHACLAEANLEQATLTAASLIESTLDGAKLTGADIREAVFVRSSLRNVHGQQLLFHETRIEQVDFSGANLDQATFIEIDLSGCDFSQASMEKAALLSCIGRCTCFRGARLRNFRVVGEGDYSGADFSGACLVEANLRGSCLVEANLSDALLDQADLSRIDGRRASLARASARGCRLIAADLRDADLSETNLLQGSLERADLRAAKLSGANLYQLQLGRAHVSRQTNFDEAYMARVNIYPLKFPRKTTPP